MTKTIKRLLPAALADAPLEIQQRHIRNCSAADPAYGKGVADALGIAPA